MQRVKLRPNYSELAAYLTQHQKKNGEYPNDYTMGMCVSYLHISFVHIISLKYM